MKMEDIASLKAESAILHAASVESKAEHGTPNNKIAIAKFKIAKLPRSILVYDKQGGSKDLTVWYSRPAHQMGGSFHRRMILMNLDIDTSTFPLMGNLLDLLGLVSQPSAPAPKSEIKLPPGCRLAEDPFGPQVAIIALRHRALID